MRLLVPVVAPGSRRQGVDRKLSHVGVCTGSKLHRGRACLTPWCMSSPWALWNNLPCEPVCWSCWFTLCYYCGLERSFSHAFDCDYLNLRKTITCLDTTSGCLSSSVRYHCDSLETLSISPGILAVLKHLTCMRLGERLYYGAPSGMIRLLYYATAYGSTCY
jgi:hypothetical protein